MKPAWLSYWWKEVRKHGNQLSGIERIEALVGAGATVCVYPTVIWVITNNPTTYLNGSLLVELDALFSIVFFPAFAAFLFRRALW